MREGSCGREGAAAASSSRQKERRCASHAFMLCARARPGGSPPSQRRASVDLLPPRNAPGLGLTALNATPCQLKSFASDQPLFSCLLPTYLFLPWPHVPYGFTKKLALAEGRKEEDDAALRTACSTACPWLCLSVTDWLCDGE